MIPVLESVIRDKWCVIISGGGLSSHEGASTGDGGGSVGTSQVPVMYFCDHSSSRSMTACSVEEGNCPVEVSITCMNVMNVTGSKKVQDKNQIVCTDAVGDRVLRTRQDYDYTVLDSDDKDMLEDSEEKHQDHLCTSGDPRRIGVGGETIILNSSELCKDITSQQVTGDQTVWITTSQTGFPLTRDEEELINSKDTQMGRPRHDFFLFCDFFSGILGIVSNFGDSSQISFCTLDILENR